MTKRKENIVQVRDPKGEVFEITRRNANDLIQHQGWKLVADEGLTTDDLATAGRTKRERGEKVKASREKAAAEKKAKSSGKKAVPVLSQPEIEVDDEPTFDEKQAAGNLDDELAALEADESARGKPRAE